MGFLGRLSRLTPPPGSSEASEFGESGGRRSIEKDEEQEPTIRRRHDPVLEGREGRERAVSTTIGQSPALPLSIEDLRGRMSAILAKHQQREEPAWKKAEQHLGDLPFTSEETEHGVLYRRVLRVGPAQRVGHAPCDYAKRADMPWLSALSLSPELAGCDPKEALYVDTETTGLSGGTGTVAFLVGLAFFDRGELVLEQLFVRSLGEEGPMLRHYLKRVEAASFLVTFNGKSFDLPLLRTRTMMARLPDASLRPHLDLLHVARRIHGRRRSPNAPDGLRLVGLERDLLGFIRHDDTPSGEVSACYLHFLRTGDIRGLLGVVEHNAWDVLTMASLVGFYGETPDGSLLKAGDLARIAGVFRRSRRLDLARKVAAHAVGREESLETLAARAEVEHACGDRESALTDFSRSLELIGSSQGGGSEGTEDDEALAVASDDPVARRANEVRLSLAKLYEHYKKDPERALQIAALGTSEKQEAHAKRVDRLSKKSGTRRRLPGIS